MNPDQPSREQIEARLTALLLGELPAAEAELLRWTISRDPELQKLHDQIKVTIGFVREAMKNPTGAPVDRETTLKLREERRQTLLAHFKSARPQPQEQKLPWLRRIKIPSGRSLAIAAIIIFVICGLAAISIPNFVKARATSQQNACINNLRQIEAAKNEWALETGKPADAVPTVKDLSPYLAGGTIRSVAGENYVLGKLSESPVAELNGKRLTAPPEAYFSLDAGQTATPGVREPRPVLEYRLENQQASRPRNSLGINAQEPKVPAQQVQPAPIALPNTESSQAELEQNTTGVYSQNVVGYVNVNPGVSAVSSSTLSSVPTPMEPNGTAPASAPKEEPPPPTVASALPPPALPASEMNSGDRVVEVSPGAASPAPSTTSPELTVAQPHLAPNTEMPVSAPSPSAPPPIEVGPVLSGSTYSVASAAEMPKVVEAPRLQSPRERLFESLSQKKDENGNNFYAVPAIPPSANADNTFGLAASSAASQPSANSQSSGGGGGTVSFGNSTIRNGVVQNGQQNAVKYFNFPDESQSQTVYITNSILDRDYIGLADGSRNVGNSPLATRESQNAQTVSDSATLRQANVQVTPLPPSDQPEQPPLMTRESQNATTVSQNSDNPVATGPTPVLAPPPPTGMKNGIVENPNASTPTMNRANGPRGAAGTDLARVGLPTQRNQQVFAYALRSADSNEVQAVLKNMFVSRLQSTVPSTPPQPQQSYAQRLVSVEHAYEKPVQANGPRWAWSANDLLLQAQANATNGTPWGAHYFNFPEEPSSSDVENLKAQYQGEEVQIQHDQSNVEQLRKQYNIEDSDPGATAPTPIVSSEQLQALNERLIEQRALDVKEEKEVAEFKSLQATNPTELADELVTINPDTQLSDLLGKLHDNEQKYANNPNAGNPDLANLKQQIANRVNGIMFGLQGQVDAGKAQADALNQELHDFEAQNNIELATGQPYWIAKARLQNEQDSHKLLARKIEADEANVSVPTGQNHPSITPRANAPIPQPEIQTSDNAFSTFSMNVSDVSFKLAMASLQKGQMPDPASIRSEEFINAFDYHDPEPLQGEPLAFMSERASDPFAHERDLLRFSIKAAAAGRQNGRALNLVLLLDTSGSMERADRVAIIREALRVLASQLQPQDVVSVVTFAREARLWADGISGDQAGATLDKVGSITPEGGTNLEEAMRLAYETALRHFIAGGMNRVVLLTDGAANLGNVDPQALTQKVNAERLQGIALDCFGIGWDDYNDDLLEQLSSNGDGRYAFINSPDEAATEFAAKLAGALEVAAEDVKVQVEFNPNRVTAWRQIGYAKHQLAKEQFRDNSVAAGAIAAREAGNALYVIETNPDGQGPIATVRVRYRVPGTQDVQERSWLVDYTGPAPDLAQSSPPMRLCVTAAEISEWMADSPFAQDVSPDDLLNYLGDVPQYYGADERPKQLEWLIREAKSVSGK
ncbi:MAG TPA: von Willebrand factor type A domain-containing protein [Candidatus Sulfotelmatobacter sp.]|nr:von Willebrand factor type A domain-containing protein [Candidatus Sulfotelmatobacter sp.]